LIIARDDVENSEAQSAPQLTQYAQIENLFLENDHASDDTNSEALSSSPEKILSSKKTEGKKEGMLKWDPARMPEPGTKRKR
jgi:hypothetical protein